MYNISPYLFLISIYERAFLSYFFLFFFRYEGSNIVYVAYSFSGHASVFFLYGFKIKNQNIKYGSTARHSLG